jgi:hypothetical protein
MNSVPQWGATFTNFTNVAHGAGTDFGELGERGT